MDLGRAASALLLLCLAALLAFYWRTGGEGTAGESVIPGLRPSEGSDNQPPNSSNPAQAANTTFLTYEGDICLENGKPVIRMYSTTTCPHCLWVKDTFDRLVREYSSQGKIAAYHWELDKYDNTLTPAYEGTVPKAEIELFKAYNPGGAVPTYVFGCRYYRIGNRYEGLNGLSSEEAEFRVLMDRLALDSGLTKLD